MSYVLNDKIKNLEPYVPNQGSFNVIMDANESFIAPNDQIKEEIAAVVTNAALNRYPDPLAAAVCNLFAQYHGIDPSLLTAGNGSDELIMLIMTAFLQKNQKIMTLSPDFTMYRFYSSISENPCVMIDKNSDLLVDVDEMIETIIKEDIKAVFFSNPCNPTSLGLLREDVRRLITATSALIVLDEAYMDFWDQSLIAETRQYDNLIILRTCSKAFGIAGIRLGFAVANEVITNALKAVKSPYNVNTVTQAIGEVFLKRPDYLRQCTSRIIASKNSLAAQINEMTANKHNVKSFKSCTNFVLLQTPNAQEIQAALSGEGIAIRRLGDYLRITAGTDAENKAVVDALAKSM